MGLVHRWRESSNTTWINSHWWPERGFTSSTRSRDTEGLPRGIIYPPPPLFNIVVDALICHWFTLVEGEEVGLDGFGRAVQWLVAFFYAKDGHLALPGPYHIEAALYVLTGLFNMVVLHTNVDKTVGMIY